MTTERIRMVEVAATAGVSRSTVSNVFRGSTTVDDDIRDRVLMAARHLGYVYNRGAALMRTQRSNIIGVVVADLGNPLIGEAVRGVQNVITSDGYHPWSIAHGDNLDQQWSILEILRQHNIDGVLLIPAIGTSPRELARRMGSIPTVVVNRKIGGRFPYVGPDEAKVATLAAEHLIRHHQIRSVAYFGGLEATAPRQQRFRQFAAQHADEGVTVVDSWCVPFRSSPETSYDIATRLLDGGQPPEGVHCHSDVVAYGLLRALAERGVGPTSCRVTSCDDLATSRLWNPALTSVSVHASDLGRASALRIMAALGVRRGRTSLPDASLSVRESCGC